MSYSPKDISKVLFLDIETVRGHKTYEDLSPAMQKMWDHKAKSLIRGEDPEPSPAEVFYDKAGIYAEFGKIVCISVGFVHWVAEKPHFRLKSFYGNDEKQLLQDFAKMLNTPNFRDWKLCAHNGKEFDYPYICRRMLIKQIPLPDLLDIQGKKPWEIPFLDTMELWKFGDWKAYTKLELLCAVFEIPTPKDDIDGSQVSQVFWEEDNVERIAIYCEKDVLATGQLFMKYNLQNLIEEENVAYHAGKVNE